MNDIRPPRRPQVPLAKRPLSPPVLRPVQSTPARPPVAAPKPTEPPVVNNVPPVLSLTSSKKPKKRRAKFIWLGILVVFIALLVGAGMWYKEALLPANPGDEAKVRVDIPEGSSPLAIGGLLEDNKLIRSKYAFEIYTRLAGVRSALQAGTYNLSPSESTPAIIEHLIEGNIDEFTITFIPGATLAENRKRIIDAGYSEAEVDAALNKDYDHPLFADKPDGTDLEGYIYPETYQFTTEESAEVVLKTAFDHYHAILKENKLIDGFRAHGVNLYQGITLASIVQREVTGPDDQKQVAQVFYTRLAEGIPLGSDVTYQYAAKKMGVTPSPSLDSPYNTRKVTGLPPGPIANPGLGALQAVAQPALTDYLYFVSGDDGINYFSHTDEEHVANVQAHCQIKCATP